MTPTSEKKALTFVLVTMLIDSIGNGIAYPVMPALIQKLSGGTLADAAGASGWMMGAYAFLQLFSAPILGKLSDAYGRRPVLLVMLFALGLDFILMGAAPTLFILFVARALSGVFCASGSIASAYITDISGSDQRVKRFGFLSAAWGLGMFIGPAVGGGLGAVNPNLPFYAAGVTTLINVVIGIAVLKESLASDNRRPFVWTGSHPVALLQKMKRYPLVSRMMLALFMFQITYMTSPSVWPFFTAERFHWSTQRIGLSLGFAGLLVTLVQALALGKIVNRIGEQKTALLGFASAAICLLALSVSNASWMLYASMVPYAVGTIGMPAMQGIVSRAIPANEQGELQGVIRSLYSFAAIGTPILMSHLFTICTSGISGIYFPGAPYLAGGVLAVIGWFVCERAMRERQIEALP